MMRTAPKMAQQSARILAAVGLALTVAAATGVPAAASPTAGGSPSASADAVTPYQVSGTEITGGDSLAAAVETEPGLYRDTLATSEEASGEGSTRFYRLPALQEGERARLAAVLAADPQQSGSDPQWAEISVQFLNQQGGDCSPGDRENVMMNSGRVPVVTTSTDAMDPESYGCFEDGSGVVVAQVTRSGEWRAEDPVPVELRFWIEPPVDESGLAPAPTENLPPESVTVTGEASPVTGGTSFATATELEPDQIYSVGMQPLEAAYFRVPVEFGQRLSYRMSTGNNQQSRTRQVYTRLYNPLLHFPNTLGQQDLSYSNNGGTLTRSTAVAVSRDNYDSYSYGALRFAGDYYIVVEASEARSGREGTEPFQFDLAVTLTGEPDGTTDWLATAQDDQAEAAGATAAGSDGGWFPSATELGALLGGVGLGAVLTGVAWIIMRRRNRAA